MCSNVILNTILLTYIMVNKHETVLPRTKPLKIVSTSTAIKKKKVRKEKGRKGRKKIIRHTGEFGFLKKSKESEELDKLFEKNEVKIRQEKLERFNSLPLIEKYRPSRLEQILLDDYVEKIINRIAMSKQLNHTIISGNPGIGKTTTSRCLGRKLHGKYAKQYVLEINASDFRGKNIRERILNFCKKNMCVEKKDKGKYPEYKIIILDEADNMTAKAQNIISDVISDPNNNTRFILTCNDSHQIIDSIQSICDIIRYRRVKHELISLRLEDICDMEKIKYEKKGVDYIAEICEGDMRSALNILSRTSSNFKKITVDNVSEIYGKPHRETLKKIVKDCIRQKAHNSLKVVYDLRKKGYNAYDIISGIFDVLKSDYCNDIENKYKYEIIRTCNQTLVNISKGVDSNIQIFSCILNMCPGN